jgi:hypothetical protein
LNRNGGGRSNFIEKEEEVSLLRASYINKKNQKGISETE